MGTGGIFCWMYQEEILKETEAADCEVFVSRHPRNKETSSDG